MSEPTYHLPPATSARPVDVLLAVLTTLLAPMFLYDSDGNLDFARLAARETIEEYRVTSRMDLLLVAQVIAFGLGALGSLSLSMVDGIDLRLLLRLRGNAVSCNRAAERNRHALERSQAAPPAVMDAHDEAYEAEVLESLRQTETMVKQAQAELAAQAVVPATPIAATPMAAAPTAAAPVGVEPVYAGASSAAVAPAVAAAATAPAASMRAPAVPNAAVPAPVAPAAATPALLVDPEAIAALGGTATTADAPRRTQAASTVSPADPLASTANLQYRAMFAAAMTEVAGEYAGDLGTRPPAQRKEASIRASALRSSAAALLSGDGLPPFRFSLHDTIGPSDAK